MLLDWERVSARRKKLSGPKGRIQMPQSSFARTLVAIVATLVMSSVTVGAAVGPASANASPVRVAANA
jgi:hypothetical protein